ncbi:MAG: hypothetical protein ACJ76H_13110 [Bacteriovoracaceae bacterium]
MKTLGLIALFLSVTTHAFVDWARLKNPVYQHEAWSVKDATMIYREETGEFYVFFSAFFESRGKIASHISGVKTKDFVTFSEPLFVWSGEEIGYKGLAAPEVMRDGDRFVMSYNSWGDKLLKPNHLFYATSPDLEHWEKHQPLAGNISRWQRLIDATLAKRNNQYVLVYKTGKLFQKSQIAVATDLKGPWKTLGRPIKDWMENGELIGLDGVLHLLMTGKGHLPYLSRLNSSDYLSWGPLTRLDVPRETFNTFDLANAAHLKDWRKYDGYFYLIYAGTTEGDSYLGRGDNRLGIARSTDLIHWEVP